MKHSQAPEYSFEKALPCKPIDLGVWEELLLGESKDDNSLGTKIRDFQKPLFYQNAMPALLAVSSLVC